MAYLTNRTITPEWLESPAVTSQELARGMAFIRKVNRQWGGVKAVLEPLKAWSRRWPDAARPITLLDLGAGSADIPLAIAQWARRQRLEVRITAVDSNPRVLDIARAHIGQEPWISLVAADVRKLPFAPGSFDYAISSLLLHHLQDIEVMTVLRIMETLSLRGMIWSDLSRHWLAHQAVWLGTLGSGQVIHHDAVASVRAGFTRSEVLSLRDRLGLGALRYHAHWPLRFTLAGEHRERAGVRGSSGR
jgi:hypothetical protein